jgi:hypothetical protein
MDWPATGASDRIRNYLLFKKKRELPFEKPVLVVSFVT